MTGGMAFVLDEDGSFERRANPESIIWRRLGSTYWETLLKALIAQHATKTDSRWSNSILDDWDRWRDHFWQVVPKEMLTRLSHPLEDDEAEMVAAE
jgi:glutamate synthase (NADPH/NADH) large chain